MDISIWKCLITFVPQFVDIVARSFKEVSISWLSTLIVLNYVSWIVKCISRTITDTFGTVLASNPQRTFTDVAATVVNRAVSSILAWSQRTGVWWKRIYLHCILFLLVYLFIYFFIKIFTFYWTVTSKDLFSSFMYLTIFLDFNTFFWFISKNDITTFSDLNSVRNQKKKRLV